MATDNHQKLRINDNRLQVDFEALAQIGDTGDGGVNRPVFSEFHLAARRWYQELAAKDGFEFHIDAAGNHSAFLPSMMTGARTLLLGSHLDSVPFGGQFDGALGVLAGYEVLRTIREAKLNLPF